MPRTDFPWTPMRDKLLTGLLSDGNDNSTIAEVMGVSPDRIRKRAKTLSAKSICAEAGDEKLARDREIQRLWNEEGMPGNEIAEKFGFDTNGITQIVYQRRKQGWEFKKRSNGGRPRGSVTNTHKAKSVKAKAPQSPKPKPPGERVLPSSVVVKKAPVKPTGEPAKHCTMQVDAQAGRPVACGKPVTTENDMGFCKDCMRAMNGLAKAAARQGATNG